ncbi:sigma-70 family RNA polymerase sigma factor [Aetokthonos hydrillicola Thurmond2011]|jgi:RNA polymerase sigma factor (sigma-70 family)|uniref:Sigma-70 family RNA polymerase sigma factor n=1 Tax=Aetokthonos hydrillicola Thurmond2011 TaxID=2712845 RepID=A0AAP5I3Q3_9CYAN|nr:sigma-70 family RNA polymerase sigma factor [Aetokthonos hydrillicola]MBO3458559.1 sigma-70 family RNA polymerase sigma factor [Aetokthonos hydrillicola CCALA 1050]MBW4585002.1 sigma-70 family RNA polymerase sigma factor [Aetokthonos hydrillicola CCALA 1050]MDR9894236.1 sigma-70 family RNA polymerase sigma factor [Aetokthonos hydrillicola Thurmond2011]
MQPRTSIVETFSTFLDFSGDSLCGWTTNTRLRRNIQNVIDLTPQETSENFWVLYWYYLLQNPELGKQAKQHLIAYLQEPCYWIAQKISASFPCSQYRIADFFQIAIAQVDQVLKGFNPKSNFVLKNYATIIFSNIISDTLRQSHEVDICTDWGLLRKVSQKRLVEAMYIAGLSPETINAYVTAWKCFKSLYVPSIANHTRRLSPPDCQTWEAIATAYKSQTQTFVEPQVLKNWLLNCAKTVRTYLYPNLTSLNSPVGPEESSDWLDFLPTNEHDSPLTQIIAQEEQQTRCYQQSEINAVLVAAVDQLEPEIQEMLQLYYAQKLTQQQIATKLQLQQYTVSRRLTKTRELLLKSLARWGQEKLHISVTSDILKSVSAVMEEWLETYYNPSVEGNECSVS